MFVCLLLSSLDSTLLFAFFFSFLLIFYCLTIFSNKKSITFQDIVWEVEEKNTAPDRNRAIMWGNKRVENEKQQQTKKARIMLAPVELIAACDRVECILRVWILLISILKRRKMLDDKKWDMRTCHISHETRIKLDRESISIHDKLISEFVFQSRTASISKIERVWMQNLIQFESVSFFHHLADCEAT